MAQKHHLRKSSKYNAQPEMIIRLNKPSQCCQIRSFPFDLGAWAVPMKLVNHAWTQWPDTSSQPNGQKIYFLLKTPDYSVETMHSRLARTDANPRHWVMDPGCLSLGALPSTWHAFLLFWDTFSWVFISFSLPLIWKGHLLSKWFLVSKHLF